MKECAMDRDFNQEKILDKMRELREQRDIEILEKQFNTNTRNQKNVSEKKVLDIKYLGKVDTFGDVYLVIEQRQDRKGNLYQVEKYETEDGKLIGGNNKSDAYDFILLSEQYKDREDLLEQLQQLNKEGILDLNEMEQDRLDAIAKELGIKGEEIERIVEIDPEKEIEVKEERKEEEKESDSEKQEEAQEKDVLSSEELESVTSKTEIDVNQKVTDSETMASLLKVQGKGYQKIQVVESSHLQEGNSTRFSFVGIKQVERNGRKVEVAEKIDTLEQRYGQSPNKEVNSLNSDGSKLEEKRLQSIYQVKGDNESQVGVNIGSAGNLEVSYIRTPRQDNAEAISIPIETRSVRPTTREVREFMNKNRNKDLTEEAERIEQHREAGCEDINMRNIDDDEKNDDPNHKNHQVYIEISDEYLDQLVDMVFERYEKLGETYNREDIKDKLKEAIEEKGQIPEKEELIKEVGTELEESAKGEHELPRNRVKKKKI